VERGNPEKAVRLLSASAALRISIGSIVDPADQAEYQNRRAALRAKLGEERFTAIWNEGRALTLEQALSYALEDRNRERSHLPRFLGS
jgi:hypothetical protein